jgi:hypothetical protein
MRNRKIIGWERYKKKCQVSYETRQKRWLESGERRVVRGREKDGGSGGGGITKLRRALKVKTEESVIGGRNGIFGVGGGQSH